MASDARKRISGAKRLATLQECFSTCPFCGLELIGSLQIHHIDGDPSNDDLGNLVSPCASCHDQITKGLKSEADVQLVKRMLEAGHHPFRSRTAPSSANSVNVAGTVNYGNIANRITISKSKSAPIILPGSIGSDPKKYIYVEYLIKRLTSHRDAGKSFGQFRKGRLHSGGTRKILENELGGLPKDLPLEDFGRVVAVLKAKIDKTILGMRNTAQGYTNYHSFEEHGWQKSRRSG